MSDDEKRPITRHYLAKLTEEQYKQFQPIGRSTSNAIVLDSSSSSSSSSSEIDENTPSPLNDTLINELDRTFVTLRIKNEKRNDQKVNSPENTETSTSILSVNNNNMAENTTIQEAFSQQKTPAIPKFISPEIFTPSKTDPEIYLRNFERTSIANGWSNNIKITYFGTFLEGIANRWYENYIEENPDKNWTEIKEAFKKEFRNGFSANKAEEAFEDAVQTSKETVTEYFYRLQLLAFDFDKDMGDKKFIKQFQKGLGKQFQNYYKLLIDEEMTMLKLKTVVQKLGLMNLDNEASRTESSGINQTIVPQNTNIRNSNNNFNNNRNFRRYNNIQPRAPQNSQNESNKNSSGIDKVETRDNPSGQRVREARKLGNCFVCGRQGHFAKDCWFRHGATSTTTSGEPKNQSGSPNAQGRQ